LGQNLQIKLCVGTLTEGPIFVKVTHQLIIGRGDGDSTSVDINLAGYDAALKGVSRRHAAVEVINKAVMVTDLNSTNGTFLNGQQIPPGQRRVLRDGDQLLLGDLLLYVFYDKLERHM
jgi:pSer/pThr/pTyr-binding forkhead associated (FHA) protein